MCSNPDACREAAHCDDQDVHAELTRCRGGVDRGGDLLGGGVAAGVVKTLNLGSRGCGFNYWGGVVMMLAMTTTTTTMMMMMMMMPLAVVVVMALMMMIMLLLLVVMLVFVMMMALMTLMTTNSQLIDSNPSGLNSFRVDRHLPSLPPPRHRFPPPPPTLPPIPHPH